MLATGLKPSLVWTPRVSEPKSVLVRSEGQAPGVPFSGIVLLRSSETTPFFSSTCATTGPSGVARGAVGAAAAEWPSGPDGAEAGAAACTGGTDVSGTRYRPTGTVASSPSFHTPTAPTMWL